MVLYDLLHKAQIDMKFSSVIMTLKIGNKIKETNANTLFKCRQ